MRMGGHAGRGTDRSSGGVACDMVRYRRGAEANGCEGVRLTGEIRVKLRPPQSAGNTMAGGF